MLAMFALESTLHGVLHYEQDVAPDNTHPREHSCYGEVLLHTINNIFSCSVESYLEIEVYYGIYG